MTHPITPPPELVEKWEAETAHTTKDEIWHVAVQAARWGADQELEACIEEVQVIYGEGIGACIRDFRRPKPPSLKEQALLALSKLPPNRDCGAAHETIRRALEQLNDE